MKFCSHCGEPLHLRRPPGDERERAVCGACGAIHYQNPRIVAGCVIEYESRILLCRRAIEPRRGFWTSPAGFMELGETVHAAAARETREEASAEVQLGSLLSVTSVLHVGQVHVFFRGRLRRPEFAAGAESLEVQLFDEAALPWEQMAFRSGDFSLRAFLGDRAAGRESTHYLNLP
jgi:ADP-ribose pyrophosphatase YjhB (NUDIX family)